MIRTPVRFPPAVPVVLALMRGFCCGVRSAVQRGSNVSSVTGNESNGTRSAGVLRSRPSDGFSEFLEFTVIRLLDMEPHDLTQDLFRFHIGRPVISIPPLLKPGLLLDATPVTAGWVEFIWVSSRLSAVRGSLYRRRTQPWYIAVDPPFKK